MAGGSLNYVDLIVLAVLALYFYGGYRRGFIRVLFEVTAFALSFGVAYLIYRPTGHLLAQLLHFDPRLSNPVGFVGAWLAGSILTGVLFRSLYAVVPSFLKNSLPNRLVGALLSTAQGAVVVGLLLLLVVLSHPPRVPVEAINGSITGGAMVHAISGVQRWATSMLKDVVRDSLPLMTVHPSSNETVKLGFKTDQFQPRPDLEKQMLVLVNRERQTRGIKPLKLDSRLVKSARAHSADMMRNGYFSHTDLKGGTPGDRIHRADVDFLFAGENLAFAPTLEMAHEGLMRSPGHRRNILSKEFGHAGIGILDGDPYGLMVTQHFTD